MAMEISMTRFLTFLAFLVFLPEMDAQRYNQQPPLCASQLALVNRACARLPYFPLPPTPETPSPPSRPASRHTGGGGGGGGGGGRSHGHGDGHGRNDSGHGHGRSNSPGHGGNAPENGHGSNHSHGRHGKDHGNGGHEPGNVELRRNERESSEIEACCRWLRRLDDECVCGQLNRLPPFLSRLAHVYNIFVSPSCNVTFECRGRPSPRP